MALDTSGPPKAPPKAPKVLPKTRQGKDAPAKAPQTGQTRQMGKIVLANLRSGHPRKMARHFARFLK